MTPKAIHTVLLACLANAALAFAPGPSCSAVHGAQPEVRASVVLAQAGRSPGKLRRLVNKARRLPRHTQVILGLCAGGMILFFVGLWAKARM